MLQPWPPLPALVALLPFWTAHLVCYNESSHATSAVTDKRRECSPPWCECDDGTLLAEADPAHMPEQVRAATASLAQLY